MVVMMVMKESGTKNAPPSCSTKTWHSRVRSNFLLTLDTSTAKVSVTNSTYLVFQLHQIAKDCEIADFAKDERSPNFDCGLAHLLESGQRWQVQNSS